VIHKQRVDAKTLLLTPKTQTATLWSFINLKGGPVVAEVPPGVRGRAKTPAETSALAERKKALKEIAGDLAPELVGKKPDAIRTILTNSIDEAYSQ
jgi:hypothetical protein